jgi:FixJ family two-component response regulator
MHTRRSCHRGLLNLAKKILAMRPDMPFILCTGHSETVSDDRARKAGIREFIMKPLSKAELADAIRRAFGGKKVR